MPEVAAAVMRGTRGGNAAAWRSQHVQPCLSLCHLQCRWCRSGRARGRRTRGWKRQVGSWAWKRRTRLKGGCTLGATGCAVKGAMLACSVGGGDDLADFPPLHAAKRETAPLGGSGAASSPKRGAATGEGLPVTTDPAPHPPAPPTKPDTPGSPPAAAILGDSGYSSGEWKRVGSGDNPRVPVRGGSIFP